MPLLETPILISAQTTSEKGESQTQDPSPPTYCNRSPFCPKRWHSHPWQLSPQKGAPLGIQKAAPCRPVSRQSPKRIEPFLYLWQNQCSNRASSIPGADRRIILFAQAGKLPAASLRSSDRRNRRPPRLRKASAAWAMPRDRTRALMKSNQ